MKKQRNMQIEGLRGVGMLFVVCYHYFANFSKNILDQPITHNWFGIGLWGYFGVSIFILISGYFMLEDRKENIVKFTIRKILRLWPAYLVAITACFLLTRLVPLQGRTVSTTEYLLNIPFLNGFIGVNYVDGAHWYLTTLIACTFISAIVSRIDIQKQDVTITMWAIAVLIFNYVELPNRSLDLLAWGIYKILGDRYACMFIMGIALKKIEKEKNINSIMLAIVCNLVNFLIFGWQREVAFLVAIALFCLVNNQKLPFLKVRPLTWLGMISYSVYVIHQNVGFCGMLVLSDAIGQYTPIISVISVLLAVGIGAILYYLVERPSSRLLQKTIDRIGR